MHLQEWLLKVQYIFNEDAGSKSLKIKNEDYKYLFKVRRHDIDDILYFRNKENIEMIHAYKVLHVENRFANLELISSKIKEIKAEKFLHVAWCVIDPKSVEKVLPSLNELGVSKITFIFCDRSQKNFKIDLKRYERILQTSSQQCGRSDQIEFDISKNVQIFIEKNQNTLVLDFCDEVLDCKSEVETVLIGCEGGFSENERTILKDLKSFRLDTPMILRSESAALAISSKVLL